MEVLDKWPVAKRAGHAVPRHLGLSLTSVWHRGLWDTRSDTSDLLPNNPRGRADRRVDDPLLDEERFDGGSALSRKASDPGDLRVLSEMLSGECLRTERGRLLLGRGTFLTVGETGGDCPSTLAVAVRRLDRRRPHHRNLLLLRLGLLVTGCSTDRHRT